MSLERAAPDQHDARIVALEARVAERERELTRIKADLLDLQARYFAEVGSLYATLGDLESSVAEIEIRLGLRPPPLDEADDTDDAGSGAGEAAGCSNRSAPSVDLRRVFRDVARAVHPDRARDQASRYRRHSLMAEANRAYAERDEDRLRLILRAWESSADAVVEDGPDADRRRAERRAAMLEEQLVAMDLELAGLRASAIWRLKTRIDEARAQGWDLLTEIVREVQREIARARSRLAALGKIAR
jgi:hypothetical protein